MTKRKNSKFSVCKKVPLNFKNIWGISPKKTFRSFKVDKKNKKKFSLFNKLIKTSGSVISSHCIVCVIPVSHFRFTLCEMLSLVRVASVETSHTGHWTRRSGVGTEKKRTNNIR